MNNFQELKLPNGVQRALQAMNFNTPTPVQAQAIPVGLSGADLIGCAQTGTGKTAAFSIPAVTKLLANPGQTALVLAPTRELVQQIEAFWNQLTRFVPELKTVSIIGGAPFNKQARNLRGARLIVATPGRLIDHIQQRTIDLSSVSVLVLDEADRMLDMGFAPQLAQIMKRLPQRRQTLLFSATWNAEMDKLSAKYLYQPKKISVGQPSRAAATIEQSAIATTSKEKNNTLLDELNRRDGSVLVFARTQARTDRLAKYLNSYGMEVGRIHGGRSQGQRNSALSAFKDGRIRVLVATDIASRGIDVSDIAHVINYDLPQSAEDYVHRIGRTGRAGAKGEAVSLVTPEERTQWRQIGNLLKSTGSRPPAFAH